MISPRDLEWAAGFLEGEGSFRCQSGAQVSAKQVQLFPLTRIVRLFGGHLYIEKTRCHPINVWHLNGNKAAGVMMTIYPLMSPRRKEQIAAALGKWRLIAIGRGYRRRCPKGHPYIGNNIIWRNDGKGGRTWRGCRICQENSGKAFRARRAKQESGSVVRELFDAK